jgi:hypothetical protein
MIAATLANMPAHRPDKSANLPGSLIRQSDAAAMLNVSERSVRNAAVVHKHAAPEIIRKVETGDISVSRAAALARNPALEPRKSTDISKVAAGLLTDDRLVQAFARMWLRASVELRRRFVSEIGLDDFWQAADPEQRKKFIANRRANKGWQ